MKKLLTLSLIFISVIAFGQSKNDSIIKRNDSLFVYEPMKEKYIDTSKLNIRIKRITSNITAMEGERDMWIQRIKKAEGRKASYLKLKN